MRRPLHALAALFAAAGVLSTGASAAGAKTLDVVLLGDSYSAGSGAGEYVGDCTRSPNTWGEVYGQLARAKGLTVNVTNAACGGSTVVELDAQLPAVTGETDLVLMMTGGNSTDVSGSVVWCFMPLFAGPNSCRSTLDASTAKAPSIEADLLTRLNVLDAKLHAGAKVVYVSYPYLAPSAGYTLKTWFASYDSGAGIRRLGDAIDDAVLGAAGAANAAAQRDLVTFVSTKSRFVGHEPDPSPWQENPSRWIHEFSGLPVLSDAYHPNLQGHRELAAATMAAAGPGGDFGTAE